MKIKHIYITKEGEPMANPEMEYPEKPEMCYSDCKEDGNPTQWLESESRFVCSCRKNEYDWQLATNQYHSGLLPFEDREIVESLMTDSVDASHKEWKVKVICGRCCGHGVLDDEIGEPPTGYDCPICEGVGHFWSDCEHPAHYAGNSEDHDYRATFKPDTLIPVDLEVEVGIIVCDDCPYKTHPCPEGCSKKVLRIKP